MKFATGPIQGRLIRQGIWLAIWLAPFCGMGCVGWQPMGMWASRDVPCTLSPNVTKTELVQHLNGNIQRVHGWRSNDVQIAVAGMPLKLQAKLAVEAPRRLRLRAASIAGDEADLGSNEDRFWFWMRRSKPAHVFTARHEQLPQLQNRMQIPFNPEWLMEALHVAPLKEADYVMLPRADATGLISLVSDQVAPSGQKVRRVILVDACHGRIVAHELYDAANRLVARAELNHYKVEPTSGAVLPQEISLDWPQAQMAMTMHIRTIEVNPAGIPAQTWQLPQLPGYPVFDLGALAGDPSPPTGNARMAESSPGERPPFEGSRAAPELPRFETRTASASNEAPEFDGVAAEVASAAEAVSAVGIGSSPVDAPPWAAAPEPRSAVVRISDLDSASAGSQGGRFAPTRPVTASSQLPVQRTSEPPWWNSGESNVTPPDEDSNLPFLPPINRGLRRQ